MIKKIHQTSKDANLSPLQQKSAELIKKHNPDLEYKLWNDDELEQLAKDSFPEVHAIWNDLLGIQKADLGRYMVLYHEGGFYADTDIFTKKNLLDNLTITGQDVCFAPSTPIWPWKKHTMTNYFLYAPTIHSKFISALIKASVSRIKTWRGTKNQSYVPKTTGRNMVVEVSKKVGGVERFQLTEVIDMFCSTTKIPSSCVVYHAGSTTRPGDHLA